MSGYRVDLEQLELTFGVTKQVWMEKAVAFVRGFIADHGYVTADDVQEWAERTENQPSPEWSGSIYGSLFAKLRTLGLHRTTEEYSSRIESNNGRKVRKWIAGTTWLKGAAA